MQGYSASRNLQSNATPPVSLPVQVRALRGAAAVLGHPKVLEAKWAGISKLLQWITAFGGDLWSTDPYCPSCFSASFLFSLELLAKC